MKYEDLRPELDKVMDSFLADILKMALSNVDAKEAGSNIRQSLIDNLVKSNLTREQLALLATPLFLSSFNDSTLALAGKLGINVDDIKQKHAKREPIPNRNN